MESGNAMKLFDARVRPRAGEEGPAPQRSNRFFTQGGEWYFHTREGAAIGPFDTVGQATQGLHDFLEFMALAEPRTLSRLYASLSV